MKVTEYRLEIYRPGDPETLLKGFMSSTPFLPVSTGDFLSQTMFPYPSHLCVVRVVHIVHFGAATDITHTVQVYTRETT